jgi:hypothetical protein
MRDQLTALLVALSVVSCSQKGERNAAPQKTPSGLPPMAATVRGEHNFGEHVIIYGDYGGRFLWGIVFPRDTMTSISYGEAPEPHCTLKLQTGITLEFRKNEVEVTRATRKVVATL